MKAINSFSEIPTGEKYSYIVHDKKSKYQLLNTSVSNESISGELRKGAPTHVGHKVHLYLNPDSILKLNADTALILPANAIMKIKLEKISAGKTILLVTGIGIVIFGIVAIISLRDLQLYGI